MVPRGSNRLFRYRESKLSGKARKIARLPQQNGIGFGKNFSRHRTMLEIATGFIFIHTSHHTRAAGHTNGGGIVVPVKNYPLLTQLVHVGGMDLVVPITSHCSKGLVVRKEKNEVRLFGGSSQ